MDINPLDLNDLQALINTGSANLPQPAIDMLQRMDTVRALFQKYESKSMIINTLVATYGITRQYAGRLYCDALNFFYLDHDVAKEAWRNIYADRLDHGALVAWETNDIKEYRCCIVAAAEMRGLNKVEPMKVPDELFDRRTIIYINDPAKLGIPQINRNDLAAFIDKHELTENQKHKLYQDAGIIDIEFSDDAEN